MSDEYRELEDRLRSVDFVPDDRWFAADAIADLRGRYMTTIGQVRYLAKDQAAKFEEIATLRKERDEAREALKLLMLWWNDPNFDNYDIEDAVNAARAALPSETP